MITVKVKHGKYETHAERLKLVKRLACHLNGEDYDNVPYMINEGDSSYWKIDQGNDWGIGFHYQSPDTFDINYRYQCEQNQYEEALFGLIQMRMTGVTSV